VQVSPESQLEGAARYLGMPPWVRAGDGKFYYGEEDAVVDYWSDYLYDDLVGSPGEARAVVGSLGWWGPALTREDRRQGACGELRGRSRRMTFGCWRGHRWTLG
jgi:hypothetical protein